MMVTNLGCQVEEAVVVLVPTRDNGRLCAHRFAHWTSRVVCRQGAANTQLPDNGSTHRELEWCNMHTQEGVMWRTMIHMGRADQRCQLALELTHHRFHLAVAHLRHTGINVQFPSFMVHAPYQV